jgi:hypothetical protein
MTGAQRCPQVIKTSKEQLPPLSADQEETLLNHNTWCRTLFLGCVTGLELRSGYCAQACYSTPWEVCDMESAADLSLYTAMQH